MKKPDLVFLTEANQDQVKRLALDGKGATCKGCGHTVIGPHDCPGPFGEDEIA